MKKLAMPLALAVMMAGGAPALAQEGLGASGGITGYITDLSGTTALIEESPREQSGSAKASVEITAETEVFSRQGQQRVPTVPEDLEAGQRVEATFVGPVAESYPVQATAGSIIILPDPNEPGGANVLPDTGGAPSWPIVLSASGCLLVGVLLRRPAGGTTKPREGAPG